MRDDYTEAVSAVKNPNGTYSAATDYDQDVTEFEESKFEPQSSRDLTRNNMAKALSKLDAEPSLLTRS